MIAAVFISALIAAPAILGVLYLIVRSADGASVPKHHNRPFHGNWK